MQNIKRIAAAWERVKQMETVEQLVDAVPQKGMETACAALLGALCLLPPIAGLLFRESELRFSSEEGLLAASFPYSDHWYLLLSYIGLLAVVVLGCVCLRAGVRLRQPGRNRRLWAQQRAMPIFLGGMLLWSALSCLASGRLQRCFFGTGYRHDGLLSYLFYAGIFAAAAQLGQKARRKVLEIFCGTAAFIALLVSLHLPALDALFHLSWSLGYANGVFNQFNHYGYYGCLAVLLCVLLTVQDAARRHGNRETVLLALRLGQLALLTNGLCLSSSGGPIVAVCAALTLWTLVSAWYKAGLRPLLLADAVVLLVFAGLHTGSWSLTEELRDGLQDVGRIFGGTIGEYETVPAEQAAADSAFTGRFGLWRAGVHFAAQRPLFGYGPDNLGEQYLAAGIQQDRPHCECIQIAASLGLPAFVLYLAGLGRHLLDFGKALPQCNKETIGLFFVVVGYFISSLAGNSMFYTTPYFFMLLAFSWRTVQEARETKDKICAAQ